MSSARYVFPLAVAAAAGYLLYTVNDILLPFVLAAVVAFLFNPVIRFFEVHGFKRGPIVVLFYLVMVSAGSASLYQGAKIVAREARSAAESMPSYMSKGERLMEDWKRSSIRAKTPAERKTLVERSSLLRPILLDPGLIRSVERSTSQWPKNILDRMPSLASGLLPAVEILVIVPFVAFFLMKEAPRVRDVVLGWLPSRYVEMTLNLFVEIDNSLGRYVRGVSLEAFLVGLLAYLGFLLIGLDYALQIALIVGLANVIPYVGPIAGGLVGGVVAAFQWGHPVGIVFVWMVCAGVRFIEDWFIQPVVMRHAVHLHPVAIIFSLMAGAELFGFWGLLFAVPLASMIKVLLDVGATWIRLQYGMSTSAVHAEVNRIPLI